MRAHTEAQVQKESSESHSPIAIVCFLDLGYWNEDDVINVRRRTFDSE